MKRRTRLARVDEDFLKLVRESGMTMPGYTRKIAENIRTAKEEELVSMKPRGWKFKL